MEAAVFQNADFIVIGGCCFVGSQTSLNLLFGDQTLSFSCAGMLQLETLDASHNEIDLLPEGVHTLRSEFTKHCLLV